MGQEELADRAKQLADGLDQRLKWAQIVKLLFVPYFGLGAFIAVGIMGPHGFGGGVGSVVGIAALILGSFWTAGIYLTFGGKRFLGMDTGFWMFGIPLAVLGGAISVYVGMR
jgi:hypothetical protein